MIQRWRRRLHRGPRQRALALVSVEALVAAPLFAITEFWLIPLLALRLQASLWAIGLLVALPVLMTALLAPLSHRCIHLCGGSRRTLVWGCSAQAFLLLPLLACNHLAAGDLTVALTIGISCLIAVAGAFAGTAWVDLMAGLIPSRIQGRYTTGRLRLFLGSKLAMALLFGGLVAILPLQDHPWAMDIMLLVALLGRAGSALIYHILPQPPVRSSGPLQAVAERPRRWWPTGGPLPPAFRRWMLVWVCLQAGVATAGPYFVPFMLDPAPLGLGLAAAPLLYSLLVQTSQLTRLLVLPVVGRSVDRLGPITVLYRCLPTIVLIPVVWAVCPFYWALVITELLSGWAWCQAEVAVSVLLYRCAEDPRQRARLVGWHQSLASLGLMTGSLAGAWLLPLLPDLLDSSYRTLFLISAVARLPALIMGLLVLPLLREHVRQSERVGWRAALTNYLPIGLLRGLPKFLRRPEA